MKDLSTLDLPRLSDGRLTVRPRRKDDAEAVAAMCDDPRVARSIPLPNPYTLADDIMCGLLPSGPRLGT